MENASVYLQEFLKLTVPALVKIPSSDTPLETQGKLFAISPLKIKKKNMYFQDTMLQCKHSHSKKGE
jgi:hypothetical protein